MADETPKMYGATSAGEHEASASITVDMDTLNVATRTKSWVTRATVGVGLFALAGVAFSVRNAYGGAAPSSDLREYLDDDLFA